MVKLLQWQASYQLLEQAQDQAAITLYNLLHDVRWIYYEIKFDMGYNALLLST